MRSKLLSKAADKFIITFLRVCFQSSDPVEISRQWHAADQKDVVNGIISNGLAGFFHHKLRTHPEWDLPAELAQGLKTAAQVIALQNAVYEREGMKITAALEHHGIPYLILKGFSLTERLYDSSGIRPVSDLDIYISRSDYARVGEILARSGYQAGMTADFRGSLEEYQAIAEAYCSEMQYAKTLGKMSINLDIHWGMDGLWEGSPLKALFPVEECPWMQYTRRVQIDDWAFNALSWEMQFLQIAGHFALHHQYQGIKWFLDLCLLLDKVGAELDWDFIYRMAGSADSRKTIAVILRLMSDELTLLPQGVPPWQTFWDGKGLPGEYSFYRRRLFSRAGKKGQYLAYIMLPLKLRDKSRVLGYYLFNPGAVSHWRSEGPIPAWRWWQPFYILYRAGEEFIIQRRSGQDREIKGSSPQSYEDGRGPNQ